MYPLSFSSLHAIKRAAKTLKTKTDLPLHQCLNVLAQACGYSDWHHLSQHVEVDLPHPLKGQEFCDSYLRLSGAARIRYIAHLACLICPDGKGTDIYWTSMGREFLEGWIAYYLAKREFAYLLFSHRDHRSWDFWKERYSYEEWGHNPPGLRVIFDIFEKRDFLEASTHCIDDILNMRACIMSLKIKRLLPLWEIYDHALVGLTRSRILPDKIGLSVKNTGLHALKEYLG